MDENALSNLIIGAAIEVHHLLGPGLLESAYEECLAYEMTLREIPFERQKAVPVSYKGTAPATWRIDRSFGILTIQQRNLIVAGGRHGLAERRGRSAEEP